MKTMHLVCKDCGYEGSIKVVTRDDQERKRIPTQPASCPQCQSRNVALYD